MERKIGDYLIREEPMDFYSDGYCTIGQTKYRPLVNALEMLTSDIKNRMPDLTDDTAAQIAAQLIDQGYHEMNENRRASAIEDALNNIAGEGKKYHYTTSYFNR
jgi:hypothetical protein